MRIKRGPPELKPYYLIFDIGATSVGAGLAKLDNTGASLLWHTRLDYSYQSYEEYTRYERAMYATLLEVGMQFMSKGVAALREQDKAFKLRDLGVSCVLAPPWFYGDVVEVKHGKKKAFTVDDKLVQKMTESGFATMIETPGTRSWEEVVGKYGSIEQTLESIQLEGYPVEHWKHKPTKEIALRGYYAVATDAVMSQVTTIVERILPHHELQIRTSTRLMSDLFKKTLWDGTTAQAILVEVLGQITSIATIRKGVLSHVQTIPVGTNHILKAAAPNAITLIEAHGVLDVLRKTKSQEGDFELPAQVADAIQTWYTGVLEQIVEQSEGVTPPELVLLMVGRNWNDFLTPSLSRSFLVPGIREERPLVVRPCTDFIVPSHKGVDVPKNSIIDSRLQVFTHALRACAYPT